jgi:DNA-binding response OmpR family regulator
MAPPRDASPIRVALIDDDNGLLTVLDRRFAALRWQREVLGYAAGPEQLSALRLHAAIVNPSITGLDYIGRIAGAVPGLALLVCTATSPVAERVRGLREGADDWITKPCHPEELVARIQAVLRRRRAGELPTEDSILVAGELAIRPDRYDAYVGPEPASLSRKEYELLYQLAVADGRVLEREEIYQRVWGYTMVRGDRSVDVFASCATSSSGARPPGATSTRTSGSATGSRPSRSTAEMALLAAPTPRFAAPMPRFAAAMPRFAAAMPRFAAAMPRFAAPMSRFAAPMSRFAAPTSPRPPPPPRPTRPRVPGPRRARR